MWPSIMLKLVDVDKDDIVLCAQDYDNDSDNLDALLKARDKFYQINYPALFPSFHEFWVAQRKTSCPVGVGL